MQYRYYRMWKQITIKNTAALFDTDIQIGIDDIQNYTVN